MSSAKITLLGFYNYNNALFDEMVLPDGVDKETLINTILMRGAEYECVYSDPNFMQKLIGSWSRQWQRVFEKWKEVTDTDFAPLDNYDRYEDWSDTKQSNEKEVGVDTSNVSGVDAVTKSNSVSGSGLTSGSDNTSGSGSTDDTKSTSAYNSSSFVNADKDVQSNTTHTDSITSTTSSSQSTSNESEDARKTVNTASNNETTRDYNDVSVHTAHIHGNIGVTTSSAMYREFYELMLQYGNIYNSIATVFLQAFVIPIL